MIDGIVKIIVGCWIAVIVFWIVGAIVVVIENTYGYILIPIGVALVVFLIVFTVRKLKPKQKKEQNLHMIINAGATVSVSTETEQLEISRQTIFVEESPSPKITDTFEPITYNTTDNENISTEVNDGTAFTDNKVNIPPIAEQLTISDFNISPIEKIDRMEGREFEEFMSELFSRRGYKTTLTPLSGDYGIDIIIEHDFGKIGVQLKRYYDKVGNSAVQEVVAGLKHYNLNSGMVITNNFFQPSAIRLAQDNNIILWDRTRLIEELSRA